MASAPSPTAPTAPPANNNSSAVAVISPIASQTPSTPPSVSQEAPISQPNAGTPDLSAPPPSPPLSSTPPPVSSPVLSSPPPVTFSPPPLSSPPPPPITPSPPPPQTTVPVPAVSAPPPATVPSPPLTASPPPPAATVLSPPPPLPISSPPPPSKSPPVPVPAVPATPAQSPPPPPRTKRTKPPSSVSSPPPPPTVSPLPSPSTASPPVSQLPIATPTPTPTTPSQNGTNIVSPTAPGNMNRNANVGNQGSNSSSSNSSTQGQGLSAGAAASIAIVVVFLVASFVVAGVLYVKKKKRRTPAYGYNSVFVVPSPIITSPKTGGTLSPLGRATTPFTYHSNYTTSGSIGPKGVLTDMSVGNSKYFTYEELHEITNGFAPNNVLGEGGFGCVYKGQLQDGTQVVVKQLTSGGGQGEREFQAEVEIISRVHHRHLVSLVGYCIQNEQRLLVYDYVANNTLHYHLHGHGTPVLEWAIRVKVAAGAAHGIAYLHEDCHPRIIHRDIKSSNILLDDDFEALVADFGLARLALDAATHVTTRVMGTFGYLAPEYASSGKLTERSDVFSFGVVLLELITGRRPVDTSRPLGDESLVEWARPLLSQALETGRLEELIDPKLEKNYNEVEMLRMIEAAAACVRHSASRRPRMSQVVRVLDSLSDEDLTNGIQPGKSELFNVANSAEIRLFQKMAFGSQDYDYNSSEFSQMSTSSTVHLNPNNRSRNYS